MKKFLAWFAVILAVALIGGLLTGGYKNIKDWFSDETTDTGQPVPASAYWQEVDITGADLENGYELRGTPGIVYALYYDSLSGCTVQPRAEYSTEADTYAIDLTCGENVKYLVFDKYIDSFVLYGVNGYEPRIFKLCNTQYLEWEKLCDYNGEVASDVYLEYGGLYRLSGELMDELMPDTLVIEDSNVMYQVTLGVFALDGVNHNFMVANSFIEYYDYLSDVDSGVGCLRIFELEDNAAVNVPLEKAVLPELPV